MKSAARSTRRAHVLHPLGPAILRCVGAWVVLGIALPVLGAGVAKSGVVAPPLAAAMVAVCLSKPCLSALPPPVQNKSSKRLTRRST